VSSPPAVRRFSAVLLVVAMALLVGGTLINQSSPKARANPLGLTPITPIRLADTRGGPGDVTSDRRFEGGGARAAGSVLELSVTGRGEVPGDSAAVMLSVTTVGPHADGFLTLYACDRPQPHASFINFVAGQVVSNAAVTRVSAAGTVCLYNSAATDLIVDAVGFVPPGGSFSVADPARLLDTRDSSDDRTIDGQFQALGRRQGGSTLELQVIDRLGVDRSASAVMLNLVAVHPSSPGYLTAYPCDSERPLTSSLNYTGGDVYANTVLSKLSAHGTVCIYSSAETDIVADVNASLSSGGSTTAVAPARLLDTRDGSADATFDRTFERLGKISSGSTLAVQVAGRGDVPPDATAVILNVAVVHPREAGVLTVFPCGTERPSASTMTFAQGGVTSNSVLSSVGADGSVCLYTSTSTHVLADVNGVVAEKEPDAAPPPSTQPSTEPAPTTTTTASTTVAPTTTIPNTSVATTTAPPTTAPPTAAPPTTAPPTTSPPTSAATTVAPATSAPTTSVAVTLVPNTPAPTTVAPTTVAPTTLAPTTTVAPTTLAPTTTVAPTTLAPTTTRPPTTTAPPTTLAPTTTQAPTTTVPPTTVPPTTVPPTTVPTSDPEAGTTVGLQRYAVPADAIVASPTGADTSPGTATQPVRTVARALALVPAGGTIVLRGGLYNESVAIYKKVTIQSWPGETVWFDGSREVSGWVADGDDWRYDGWTVEFDTSPTYTRGAADNQEQYWGFVNAAYPMAAHPDQIFIDGTALRQVGSRAEVTQGTFFHDRPADRLYIGSSPTGRKVNVSSLIRAIMVRADGVVLRGFGIRRYSPSVPDMGAVTLERSGATVEHVAVVDSATSAIHAMGANITLRNVYLARSGMLGMSASNADNIVIDRMLSEHNNVEHFNESPVAGGAKLGRLRVATVRNSIFRNNLGTGLWFDESVYDMRIVGVESRNNDKHGISLEISAKAVVIDSIIAGNDGYGIKVNNTSDVRIWNNTFVGNDRSINIVQDARRYGDGSAGKDPRYPNDPTMTWVNGPVGVVNNVLSNQARGNCLLCVEDYSKQLTAEQMRVTANGNVYNRPSSTSPSWVAVWSRGATNPATYTSLSLFAAGTGQERNGIEITGNSVVTSTGVPTAYMPGAGALPLPTDLAQMVGQPAGTAHFGAW
jgi:hypothetical protein